MTTVPSEIGTLIVVVLKAKNLPNKRHIGKQDPYCTVKHNGETRRTRAIKRGGQHPEWDEEVRFTIFEEVEEEQPRVNGAEDLPPLPPPKRDEKKERKIKGGMKMQLLCYADDPREPDLIGETNVDLTEVLTKGETDEWFTLTNKEKYCGEVYLELTFWSNEKPPEKKSTPQVSAFHPQYGGPGSFTPSGEIPAALKHGGNTPSPSRVSPNGGTAVPSALRPSSSLASINLYKPPYERQSRYSDVDRLTNDVSNLSMNGAGGRRESFPPNPAGLSEFGYAEASNGSYSTLSSTSSISSVHSIHTSGRLPGHHRNSLSSLSETFSPAEEGYSSSHPNGDYSSYAGQTSTGFVQHPGPSHTPVPYGYNSSSSGTLSGSHVAVRPHHRYSLPAPGEAYVVPELDTMPIYPPTEPVPHADPGAYPSNTFSSTYQPSHGFVHPPAPSRTPVPTHYNMTSPAPPPAMSSGFVSPQPPASEMSFHAPQHPQQQYPPQSSHISVVRPYSQPPVPYASSDGPIPPPSLPHSSHSAPSLQVYPHTPSPPHHNQTPVLPVSAPYPPIQLNGIPPGSRPLPIPSQPSQLPSQSTYAPGSSNGAPALPSATPFQPPGPPPPPPPRRNTSLPPTPTKTTSISYPPPPPPSLPSGGQYLHISSPPPPPTQAPSQFQSVPPPPPPPPLPPHTPNPGYVTQPHTPNQQSYVAPAQPPPPHGQWTTPPPPGPSTFPTPSHSQQSSVGYGVPPPPFPQGQSYYRNVSSGRPPPQGQEYYQNPPIAPLYQQTSPWGTPPPPPAQHHPVADSWR